MTKRFVKKIVALLTQSFRWLAVGCRIIWVEVRDKLTVSRLRLANGADVYFCIRVCCNRPMVKPLKTEKNMTKQEIENLLHVLGLDYEAEPSLIYVFYTKPDGCVDNFSISVRRGRSMSDEEITQFMSREYPATRDGRIVGIERQGGRYDEWLDSVDVCRMLHISCRTLQRLVKRGALKPSRMGRRMYFSHREVDRAIRANMVQENGRIDKTAFLKKGDIG